jgi:hypothetical protein
MGTLQEMQFYMRLQGVYLLVAPVIIRYIDIRAMNLWYSVNKMKSMM